MSEYATVDEVIEMLQKLSDAGMGDFVVVCNNEYYFAKKDEKPDLGTGVKMVSFGGYI